MPAKLRDNPLAVDGPLTRVVKDMHLPEAQEDLPPRTADCLLCITISDVGYHNGFSVHVKSWAAIGPWEIEMFWMLAKLTVISRTVTTLAESVRPAAAFCHRDRLFPRAEEQRAIRNSRRRRAGFMQLIGCHE